MAYFSGKIFFTILLLSILKISKQFLNIVIPKKIIRLTISATGNFTFEIGNRRIVENTFPEEISHDL